MESGQLTRICATMPVHRRLLARNPNYRVRRERLESGTFARKRARSRGRTETTVIPVVVHVVYRTLEESVSTDQVASQIAVLNQDFNARNSDRQAVPAVWQSLIGDARIRFELAESDPDGVPTSGIIRVATSVDSFGDDDSVKYSAGGGAEAWPADRYLNMWVCNLQGILGYAQFPGGPAQTDGVVINYRAFGTGGTAEAPFDSGRTATHEVGHWLNLFHIWGDDGDGCDGDDFVEDTPNQAGSNTGNPAFPHITCNNEPYGDMFVNYMDYVDDRSMVMFTAGQVERMHTALDLARSTFDTVAESQPEEPPTSEWLHTDVTAATGAPDAAGDPVLIARPDGTICVFYRGEDHHIHAIRLNHCISM